ncbi:MAG: DUF4365 domain-containing protein [Bacteroidales bacterium]|nr:DUF4365 domain-containing protein [Bacteroidales bacterium]
MINSRRERRAIYDTANIFTEFGWFFREQPILDFGIDAFVETSLNGKPSGMFIALQIKGGDSNFHRSKTGLNFYFSEAHKQYWLEVGKSFPIFIILQDSKDNKIYWEQIKDDTISETTKNWKVVVPFSNVLSFESKKNISKVINSHIKTFDASEINNNIIFKLDHVISKDESDVYISYEINDKTGLVCQIFYNEGKVNVKLNYYPKFEQWDTLKNELKWDDPYYFTLHSLVKYIENRYKDLLKNKVDQKSILKEIKDEIEGIVKNDGIEGVAKRMFDNDNINIGVYKYDSFIEAFEHFAGLKKEQYKTQTVGHFIQFQTDTKEYEMDTYEGKTFELKSLIEDRSYDEIYTITNENIWSEIYLDTGIKKRCSFLKCSVNGKSIGVNYTKELTKK